MAANPRRALALVVVLAVAAPAAWCVELGTLFFTPEERARLDRLRRGEPEPAAAQTVERTGTPSITGYVKRSDGRNTVWIDGSPVPVARPDAGAILQPGSVRAYSDRPDESVRVERKPRR